MSQDPYPSDRPSGGPGAHQDDGGPYGREGDHEQHPPYQQYPPYRQEGGPAQYLPYQPGLYRGYAPGMYAPTARTLEGEKAAQLSIVLGIVGFFVAGLILGPLAIWQAGKAERLGVPATAGKVLGWILTILYGGLLLLGILLMILLFAGIGMAGSLGN